MIEQITKEAKAVVLEMLSVAKLKPNDIFVVGCSSSKIIGQNPGTHSDPAVAQAVLDGIYPVLQAKGIFVAAQCCEHLNRAIILEADAAKQYGLEVVNAVPQPKAGGSFATCLYKTLVHPVAVESISANAGIDIGGVLIGMQIKKIAVPVPLEANKIGEAMVIGARTRPKFIGGERTVYNSELM